MIPHDTVDIVEGISIAILVIPHRYGGVMMTLMWYEVIDLEEDTTLKYPYLREKYPITWIY